LLQDAIGLLRAGRAATILAASGALGRRLKDARNETLRPIVASFTLVSDVSEAVCDFSCVPWNIV
jgi:hypothetical protein